MNTLRNKSYLDCCFLHIAPLNYHSSDHTYHTYHTGAKNGAKQVFDFGYCRSQETLVDHRLVGGMKSGVFTEHGTVNNFQTCVEYCCKDRTCDLAYQVRKHRNMYL